MKPVFIFGASGHGKVVMDIIQGQRQHSIAGVLDDDTGLAQEFYGTHLLGTIDEIATLCQEHQVSSGTLTIGDNWARHLVAERIKALVPEFRFIPAIHPSAQIAKGATIGQGSVIMAGAIIGPDASVGEHCIVNHGAQLDHDSVLEDYSSLAPGAVAGGNVRVGSYSAISLKAGLIHGVSVGRHSVVGAGAVVMKNVPEGEIWYGVPARKVRDRQPGDKYL